MPKKRSKKKTEEDSRTVIKDNLSEVGRENVMNISFSVIKDRMPGYGGFECRRINAQVLDHHYLLRKSRSVDESEWVPFGIVEVYNSNEAINRMYEESKKEAQEVAKGSGNKVLDLSSLAKEIPPEGKYYR